LVPPIIGIFMKKIIVVFLTLSLIGCGSNAKKGNLSQEDVKYNLEQAKYFKSLAIEADKKKDIELACQYTKSALDYATKAGDNQEIRASTLNTSVCFYELSTKAYEERNYSLSCGYAKSALDNAIKANDNDRIKFYSTNKDTICNTAENQQVDKAQAQHQSNIAGAMLGRWYHQSEHSSKQGVYFKTTFVDEYLANGQESTQAQMIMQVDSKEIACIINFSYEWSVSGNTLYEKLLNVHVAPDWYKSNGQVIEDNQTLINSCNIIKEDLSKKIFMTDHVVIKHIDDEKKVQESVLSNGEIETHTHYRTTNSFNYYRKD